MGLKSMLLKKMLKSKMPNVSDADVDKLLGVVEKNPELFQKIGKEVQEKVKGGKDQMSATMEVMQKYQGDLKGLM